MSEFVRVENNQLKKSPNVGYRYDNTGLNRFEFPNGSVFTVKDLKDIREVYCSNSTKGGSASYIIDGKNMDFKGTDGSDTVFIPANKDVCRNINVDLGKGNDVLNADNIFSCSLNLGTGNDELKLYNSADCNADLGEGNDFVHEQGTRDCKINLGLGSDKIKSEKTYTASEITDPDPNGWRSRAADDISEWGARSKKATAAWFDRRKAGASEVRRDVSNLFKSSEPSKKTQPDSYIAFETEEGLTSAVDEMYARGKKIQAERSIKAKELEEAKKNASALGKVLIEAKEAWSAPNVIIDDVNARLPEYLREKE